mmetsp:Transcript_7769/g.19077  ORF Transcript_7769/g.19077 Transcript_7769/m.19077 type:complete len:155 (+) Transcript_7769:1177-1641(+)
MHVLLSLNTFIQRKQHKQDTSPRQRSRPPEQITSQVHTPHPFPGHVVHCTARRCASWTTHGENTTPPAALHRQGKHKTQPPAGRSTTGVSCIAWDDCGLRTSRARDESRKTNLAIRLLKLYGAFQPTDGLSFRDTVLESAAPGLGWLNVDRYNP